MLNKDFQEMFKVDSDLMSRKESAKYLGITVRTLAVWACTKRYNLNYCKMGRLVKYRKSDLDKFIAERMVWMS